MLVVATSCCLRVALYGDITHRYFAHPCKNASINCITVSSPACLFTSTALSAVVNKLLYAVRLVLLVVERCQCQPVSTANPGNNQACLFKSLYHPVSHQGHSQTCLSAAKAPSSRQLFTPLPPHVSAHHHMGFIMHKNNTRRIKVWPYTRRSARGTSPRVTVEVGRFARSSNAW